MAKTKEERDDEEKKFDYVGGMMKELGEVGDIKQKLDYLSAMKEQLGSVDDVKKQLESLENTQEKHGQDIITLKKSTERLEREDCRYKFVMFPKRAAPRSAAVPSAAVPSAAVPPAAVPYADVGALPMAVRKGNVVQHLVENFPDVSFGRARVTILDEKGKMKCVFVRLDCSGDVHKIVTTARVKPGLSYWIAFSMTNEQRKEDAERQEKFKGKRLEDFARRNNISKEDVAKFLEEKK